MMHEPFAKKYELYKLLDQDEMWKFLCKNHQKHLKHKLT